MMTKVRGAPSGKVAHDDKGSLHMMTKVRCRARRIPYFSHKGPRPTARIESTRKMLNIIQRFHSDRSSPLILFKE